MKSIKILLIFVLFVNVSLNAQDSLKTEKVTHKVFANIFTAGYYNFNTKKPNAGFELSTALLGYRFKKGDNLQFTIIYDVTHTTSGIQVQDTSGNNLEVNYFAGSEYTAFLKMAEIKWFFADNFSFSAGQLLNEQYLTVQDRFWGHRYILTTIQELFRFGNPADFGMRVEYKDKEKFAFSMGANNGNGPFYHQDTLAVLEYTSNFELYIIKDLLIKAYTGLMPSTYKTDKDLKTTFSGFIAYKQPRYKVGVEYSYVNNTDFTDTKYSGVSAFVAYNITKEWELFTRYDYVDNSKITSFENVYLAGFQFQPQKNLFLSLNYRYWSSSEISQLYFNVGAKF